MKTTGKTIALTEIENELIERICGRIGTTYSSFLRRSALEKAREIEIKLKLEEMNTS